MVLLIKSLLEITIMNRIFDSFPLPARSPSGEYDCGRGSYMLLYGNSSIDEFERLCADIESVGRKLFDRTDIEGNLHCTFGGKPVLHAWYCPSEAALRLTADPYTALYATEPEQCPRLCGNTLWQFEVDHSLIDCGMCYIVRCCDGSFFVIDSAHMYSVNDDIRILEFLRKVNGGRKPTVAGWFFSHGHEDHVAKFSDILEFHSDKVDIETVYFNFPSYSHPDSAEWDESSKQIMLRFEREVDKHPEIKKVRLHTGQRFYVRDLEFTVLCTHEDIYPNPLRDFNNSSTAIMMTASGCKVLFPGDCAGESDKVFLRRYSEALGCSVVQISHHGHFGTSSEFYRRANAECALFPITEIKFDEEWEKQEPNRVAVGLAKEYYIASNGTVEIPLPYSFGGSKLLPDETFEDFGGIFALWCYEYTDEYKEKLRREFLKRSGKKDI